MNDEKHVVLISNENQGNNEGIIEMQDIKDVLEKLQQK